MDQNVSSIVAGTVYGVRPTHKKRSGQDGAPKQPFSLNSNDPKTAQPPDATPAHEPLRVSKPTEEEAGGRIDLTA